MGKPTICKGENKCADQLCGNCEADQRLCFRYMDSTILLLLKSEISSLMTTLAGLCWTWLESQIVGFLTHRLKYDDFRSEGVLKRYLHLHMIMCPSRFCIIL